MIRAYPPEISRWYHHAFYALATLGHAGRLRPASGTWGSIMAFGLLVWLHQVPLADVIWLPHDMALPTWDPFLLRLSLGVFALGWLLCIALLPHMENPDPSEIVIDEAAGLYLALAMVPQSLAIWCLVFILFRLFDAVKRGPVGWVDRVIKGAFGIMADDMVAGLLAGLIANLILLSIL